MNEYFYIDRDRKTEREKRDKPNFVLLFLYPYLHVYHFKVAII